jgi:rare lipoprotein A
MAQVGPYKAQGIASWYGRRYHGQPTSSGERYDMYAMTAAHTTLPIPSYARVTSMQTGKSVIVRINDRGPFHSDRIIDLSYAAAHRLGLLNTGSGMVEVEAILPSAAVETGPQQRSQPADATDAALAAERAGVYVQLGAFGTKRNAHVFLTRLQTQMTWLAPSLAVYAQDGVYRVHAGPYTDPVEASYVASRIEQAVEVKPVVITR